MIETAEASEEKQLRLVVKFGRCRQRSVAIWLVTELDIELTGGVLWATPPTIRACPSAPAHLSLSMSVGLCPLPLLLFKKHKKKITVGGGILLVLAVLFIVVKGTI